jgi:Protein of unknown function (DUF4232)
MYRRIRIAVLAALAGAAMVTAGCTVSTTPTDRAGSSVGRQHTSSSTSTVAPTSKGTSAPGGPTTSTTPNVTSVACRNGQVTVSVGRSTAGLGHEGQVLLFTNRSSSPCSLSGYPGAAGLNAQGQQVVQASRTVNGYLGGLVDGVIAPPVVMLAPGAEGSAMVEGTDNPVGTETSCPTYPALLVTPPDLTMSTTVRVSDIGSPPTTGLPGCSRIQVHPVVPGTTGSTPGNQAGA